MSLLLAYAYPLIALGTFFEGETALLIGGFAAQRGYLNLELVILFGFVGTICGDQFWFWIGSNHGQRWLEKHPRRAKRVERVQALLHRHSVPVILGFRFLYGFRSVTPLALGASGVDWRKFTLLNTLGAIVWSVGTAWLGLWVGELFNSAETAVGHIKYYELLVLGFLVLVVLLIWLAARFTSRRMEVGAGESESQAD